MNKWIKKSLVSVLLLGVSAFQVVLAGQGALLGLQIVNPNINFRDVGTTQGVNYDGVNLTITATPIFATFTSGGTDEFILSGSLSLTAPIDTSGVIAPNVGTFTVSGNTTDSATSTTYNGVLLSGTVVDYGILDVGGPGGTDLADFKLNVTGGLLMSLFAASGGSNDAAAIVSIEGSGYSGSFAVDWTGTGAKGDIGPVPTIEPAPPVTIGFWKNHPESWPVSGMTICGNTLDQDELISVLRTPSRRDKTIILTKQLIAANLNIATGSSCSTVTAAETWLCDHGGIGASRKDWDGGEVLKNEMDDFNNGVPDACTM